MRIRSPTERKFKVQPKKTPHGSAMFKNSETYHEGRPIKILYYVGLYMLIHINQKTSILLTILFIYVGLRQVLK